MQEKHSSVFEINAMTKKGFAMTLFLQRPYKFIHQKEKYKCLNCKSFESLSKKFGALNSFVRTLLCSFSKQ